ncbi:MAG TPA: acyltransferase [Croceibacterium sp.]|jgi:peptidoglycan/LPS O-acetylase OafA/YrhL
MAERNRFVTLDALRGIAAIGVMLYHSMPDSPLVIPGGYLAVDLFFVLSGFVIAFTYEHKLREGMTPREFLTLRAIRLWPMLLVGAGLGIALYGGQAGMLFLLPSPYSDTLYPSNPPLWSLMLEGIAYLGFATFAWRLRTGGLVVLAGVSAATLAGFAFIDSGRLHEFGAFWSSLPAGLARVAFSFTMGMLIYRVRRGDGLRHGPDKRAWSLVAGLLGVIFFMPDSGRTGGLLAILLVFPAMLWFASKWELPLPRAGLLLGAVSYPLYCIHVPILAATAASAVSRPVVWAILIPVSLMLDRWWDRPVRRWLLALRARSEAQTRIGIST